MTADVTADEVVQSVKRFCDALRPVIDGYTACTYPDCCCDDGLVLAREIVAHDAAHGGWRDILTKEERRTVECAAMRWNDESEVGQLRCIIDRLAPKLPPSPKSGG